MACDARRHLQWDKTLEIGASRSLSAAGRPVVRLAGISGFRGPGRLFPARECARDHVGHRAGGGARRPGLNETHAMKGEVELARELWSDGRQVYVDAGLLVSAASFAQGGAQIAFRAGDLHSEEALLRDSLEILEGIGERAFYSTQALQLAECLYRAGADVREIEALCAKARETTPAEDLVNFVWLDMVSGLLHARRGEYEQAEEHSRRAVALTETTDFHFARSYSRAYLAEVLALSSRGEEAVGVAAEAFEIFEAKGDVTAAAQFRSRLSSLGVEVV
jgi:tetratricopeptide (TPR) repeat protein